MGMTQEELAEAFITKKSTISAYENDKIDIKVSILRDFVKTLNTTAGYLMVGDEMVWKEQYCFLLNFQTCRRMRLRLK